MDSPPENGKDDKKPRPSIKSATATVISHIGDETLRLKLTAVGFIVGIIVGVLARAMEVSDASTQFIAFPGDLWRNLLYMMGLPLIIVRIVSALSESNLHTCVRTLLYALVVAWSMNMCAVFVGLAVPMVFQAGKGGNKTDLPYTPVKGGGATLDFGDVIFTALSNIVPENLIEASFRIDAIHTVPTVDRSVHSEIANLPKGWKFLVDYEQEAKILYKKKFVHVEHPNTIGTYAFFVVFGITAGVMRHNCVTLILIFKSVSVILKDLCHIVFWLSPLGVGSRVATIILSSPHLAGTAGYYLPLALGFTIHVLLMCVLYYLISHKNPFLLLRSIAHIMVMGGVLQRSDPVFPMALLHMEDVWRCDKRTMRLVLPIAAFSNYHGGTIWAATSTVWLGHLYGASYGVFDVLNAGIRSGVSWTFYQGSVDGLDTIVKVSTAALNLSSDSVGYVSALGPTALVLMVPVDVCCNMFIAAMVDHLVKTRAPQSEIHRDTTAIGDAPSDS